MRRKKDIAAKAQMKKPKWKVGDVVDVEFIGVVRSCEILSLKKNKHDTTRWVYEVVDRKTNTIIPYVGIENSERWANIKILEENS